MSAITSIDQLKREIRRGRELVIKRPMLDYTHHVFVGEVDDDRCYLYQYTSASAWKLNSSHEKQYIRKKK